MEARAHLINPFKLRLLDKNKKCKEFCEVHSCSMDKQNDIAIFVFGTSPQGKLPFNSSALSKLLDLQQASRRLFSSQTNLNSCFRSQKDL